MRTRSALLLLAAIVIGFTCFYFLRHSGKTDEPAGHAHADGNQAEEAAETGLHRGRLLRSDDFAIEIMMAEESGTARFRAFPYQDDKPVASPKVQLSIELARLGGDVDRFEFVPDGEALAGSSPVAEPHSFDVKVMAVHDGKTYQWAYESYEGRTRIDPEAVQASGITSVAAGPAVIEEKIQLTGRVALNPNTTAMVKARFPGIVREVQKKLGDSVAAGDVLAMVESNDSLLTYPVKAPIGGIILLRSTNVGDVAADGALFTIANLTDVWAEFHVFSRDMERVKAGQTVRVASVQGNHQSEGVIASLLPVAEADSQTVVARVTLDNADGKWRAGMSVRGDVVLSKREVSLAVKTSGLQRFQDSDVIFEQVGDEFEVRMLELGLNDGVYAEVLGGLKPGSLYVDENSYLVKADIEKSGASHDH